MIQLVLVLILASFIIGLLGFSVNSELESVVMDLLTGEAGISGLTGSWQVLVGFLILFLVPVSGFTLLSYMLNSDNPRKRAELFEGLKRTCITLVLVSVSFFLYELVLVFTQGFTELSVYLVSLGDQGFRESVFYSPVFETSVSLSGLLSGSLPSETIFEVYKSGFYTVSMLFLVATLGFQKVLARFGVFFLPLALFVYNLPFSFLEGYGRSILKGLALVLFLPFLDVLLLSVAGTLPRDAKTQQVVYILCFSAIALFNWSIIKKVILTPFSNVSPRIRLPKHSTSVGNGSDGERMGRRSSGEEKERRIGLDEDGKVVLKDNEEGEKKGGV